MAGDVFPSASPVVEAQWLRDHLASVIVLDCSVERIAAENGDTRFAPGHALFERGHIPGARFADVMGAFSDPDARYPFTCPTRAGLEAAARAVGMGTDSAVVAYDGLGSAYAARVWCVLTAFGFDNVRVLNGGYAAWTAAGGDIETGPARPFAAGDFHATRQPDIFVGADYVLRLIEDTPDPAEPLICGLRAAQFTGADGTDPRRGHIPTSLNLPYPDLIGADGRIEAGRVKAALSALGLGTGMEPVLYCGGGINAAGLALALRLAGIGRVKIYDDSMNGWRADPSLPVEQGEGRRTGHV